MNELLSKLSIADYGIIASWVVSLGYWIVLLRKRAANQLPLVAPESRPRTFWSMAEFFVCFGLFLLCAFAGQRFGIRYLSEQAQQMIASGEIDISLLDPNDRNLLFLLTNIASVLALVSVLVWMNLTTPRHLIAYGFLPVKKDIVLGLKASLLILPPVLLISLVVNEIVQYEHPALDLLEGTSNAPQLTLLVFIIAIWAPLFEEIVFRGLLQGGAQRAALQIVNRQAITLGADVTQESPVVAADEVKHWPWWPVMMSSTVFALLHAEQGGAWIPLFFMALGLGYLYRQTGRLGPGMIVHFVLNMLTTVNQLLS